MVNLSGQSSKFEDEGGGGISSCLFKITIILTDLAISKSMPALSFSIPAKLVNSSGYFKQISYKYWDLESRDKEMEVPAQKLTLLPHNANYPKYQPPPNVEFP